MDKQVLETKIKKQLPEFVGEVASLGEEQLNSRLVQLAKDSEAVEQQKDDDEKLEQARTEVLNLSAPYRDAKKVLRLKTSYIISLLKDQGHE